ncbi:MAG: enoyl-CoA hydratase/isomerase family protein [Deltaproteobacteria bacterium]|jgi:enoyl-CoA hydratase|nr:enoyl-CoA hydratase/isomerase family protein [Deltaproteobacteria bacterium]
MWENLILDVQDGLAFVTLNRTKQLNALNEKLAVELGECADKIIQEQDKIDVVIIAGSGDRAFVAGADIGEMLRMDPQQAIAFARLLHQTNTKLDSLPQPVIASINGFCLGGGNELAIACDIRIASDKSKFGQPEVGLGITPGAGGTQRLPRLIGPGRAKYMDYTGEIIDAKTALEWGLIDILVPEAELKDKVLAVAKKIQSQRRFAVRQVKQCIRLGKDAALEAALEIEVQAFSMCFTHPDRTEAMGAFVNKSKK